MMLSRGVDATFANEANKSSDPAPLLSFLQVAATRERKGDVIRQVQAGRDLIS